MAVSRPWRGLSYNDGLWPIAAAQWLKGCPLVIGTRGIMKKNDLGQAVAILANIGVLAGIIFVAYEIRQSNRIAVGTTSYELNRHWMTINELYMTSPEVLDLIVELGNEDFAPEDRRQREQAEAYARRLLNNWIAIEEAYDNGIASDVFYSLAVEDVKALIHKRPGILQPFETVASQYDLSKYRLLEPLVQAIQKRQSTREESPSVN